MDARRKGSSVNDVDHSDRDEDEWQPRLLRVPKGTHLSASRDTRGAERTLLRDDDTNRNLGPAESKPLDAAALQRLLPGPPRPSNSGSGRAEPSLGRRLAIDLYERIPPEDQRAAFDAVWDYGARLIRLIRAERAESRRAAAEQAGCQAGTDIAVRTPDARTETSEEAGVSVNAPVIEMTCAEFRDLVVNTLTAEAYAKRQRRKLAHAWVNDAEISTELRHALRLALDGKAASLAEDELADVMTFLEGARATDGEHALLRGPGGSGRAGSGRAQLPPGPVRTFPT